jgi:hypothetical protein
MRYFLFKKLLKARIHVDLHQTEPVPKTVCVVLSIKMHPDQALCAECRLDSTITVPVSVCHRVSYAETYSRSTQKPRMDARVCKVVLGGGFFEGS